MKAINQKSLKGNYKCCYYIRACHVLSEEILLGVTQICCFFQENCKVVKTGVMILQQNLVKDS